LLYQEYRDKSTLQEIEPGGNRTQKYKATQMGPRLGKTRQRKKRRRKRRSWPAHLRGELCLRSACSATPTPGSTSGKTSEIQSSGVLDILQPEEVKLQEAMFELVTSEASYYKSLNLLVSHFMENERLKKILHPSEAHILFSNVLDVMAVSERFLLELEHRMEENIVISDVCDIVCRYAADHFSVYITYVQQPDLPGEDIQAAL
ncbi:ephexin-1-like, partial [Acomys russatus]|uniref:ephexin-1-like n=1 Tax=Acomys russatus TaxID=60746 RepID=UPI0021E21153